MINKETIMTITLVAFVAQLLILSLQMGLYHGVGYASNELNGFLTSDFGSSYDDLNFNTEFIDSFESPGSESGFSIIQMTSEIASYILTFIALTVQAVILLIKLAFLFVTAWSGLIDAMIPASFLISTKNCLNPNGCMTFLGVIVSGFKIVLTLLQAYGLIHIITFAKEITRN